MENIQNNTVDYDKPLDLDTLLDSCEFSSRPSIYFSPYESLPKGMGSYTFTVQLVNQDVFKRAKITKQKKNMTVFEMVVIVQTDCRKDEDNQSCTGKLYLFDANEAVMHAIQAAKRRGVDIYATPMELTTTKTRKGTRVIPSLDCSFLGAPFEVMVKGYKTAASTTGASGADEEDQNKVVYYKIE
jgi:hypothetical protein